MPNNVLPALLTIETGIRLITLAKA